MIDSHCHIDDPAFQDDLAAVVARQQEAGVEAIVVPGVNVDSCRTVPEICAAYPGYLYPALGLHPEDVKADWREQLAAIREAIASTPGIVAIGEIGLDYHFSTEFRQEQQEAFREQLRWATELNLPVILHARDAAEDTLKILREFSLRGVSHCFSGSYEVAQQYLKLGFYLGIGGVLTFKNCRLGETLCPQDGRPAIPLERLLLETDAPYMAPVPHRGKTNESRFMVHVVAKLAELYGVTENDVILATNRSSKSLFCIK